MAWQFDGNIGSVQDLLRQLEKSGLANLDNAHARVWFRGQPNEEWQLVPGVLGLEPVVER